jgi:hypothetical protein
MLKYRLALDSIDLRYAARLQLPNDITRQAGLAWAHITHALEKANIGARISSK